MNHQFVITGTDTGVGKTIFSAALSSALGAHYWKPIQSGVEEETDSDVIMRLGCHNQIIPESWKLNTPVSPHFAAKLDRVVITTQTLLLPQITSPLIIEGAGGLFVPLTDDALFIDIFAKWQIPVILCSRTALGTINHTLLSIEALRHRAIPIHGIVFIGHEEIETQRIIAKMSKTRILGRLPWLDPLTPDTLRGAFHQHFNLADFRNMS